MNAWTLGSLTVTQILSISLSLGAVITALLVSWNRERIKEYMARQAPSKPLKHFWIPPVLGVALASIFVFFLFAHAGIRLTLALVVIIAIPGVISFAVAMAYAFLVLRKQHTWQPIQRFRHGFALILVAAIFGFLSVYAAFALP